MPLVVYYMVFYRPGIGRLGVFLLQNLEAIKSFVYLSRSLIFNGYLLDEGSIPSAST